MLKAKKIDSEKTSKQGGEPPIATNSSEKLFVLKRFNDA